jgi:hypothetical protein
MLIIGKPKEIKMQISINMKQFKENWIWNTDTVFYGDQIAKTNGSFYTFSGDVYKKLLTDFNIFFTAA